MTSPADVGTGEGRRRRWWPWLLGVAGVLVVGAGVAWWLVSSWMSTYEQAQAAQSSLSSLRSAVSDGDVDAVVAGLPDAAEDVRVLAKSTGELPWQLLTAVPLVGSDAGAVSDLAFAANLVLTATMPLRDSAASLLETGLRRPDGSFDLDTAEELAPRLEGLAGALTTARDVLAPIEVDGLRPEIGDAVGSLRTTISDATPVVSDVAEVTTLLPIALGTFGPRNWLLLLQNPAESRGSGGFLGGYAVVTADGGRLSLGASGLSGDLSSERIPATSAPEDARLMWGSRLNSWNTYSDTPHFPTVGALSAEGMAELGVEVDGVLAFDPATVAAVLSVTGPIQADGRTLTEDNVEQFFLEDLYREYPDSRERDEVTSRAVTAVLTAFLSSPWNPVDMIEALSDPLGRQKIRAWSQDPEEQAWLESTSAGGVVPIAPGPIVAVVFSNSAANKMDAFVSTSVVYRPGTCPTSSTQTSTVEVTMRNDAPASLPNDSGYYGRSDVPNAPEGSTSLVPYLYTPVNATFVSSAIDGVESTEVFGNGERGRAAYFANIGLDRGQERTVSVTFQEPTLAGVAPEVLTHGMARDTVVEIVPDPTCR